MDLLAALACVSGSTALYGLVVLFQRPCLWLPSVMVVLTAGALIALPAIDALRGGGEWGAGCGVIVSILFVGPFHLGFLLILGGSVIEERKHDAAK
jgi:hypothetical protein